MVAVQTPSTSRFDKLKALSMPRGRFDQLKALSMPRGRFDKLKALSMPRGSGREPAERAADLQNPQPSVLRKNLR
jgi:hypothetical protein